MRTTTRLLLGLLCVSLAGDRVSAGELSKSFELRYFTGAAEASGVTDFRGKSEIFSTEQRVEYLRQYADYAKRFFGDPNLDTLIVGDDEARTVVAKIKPQPLPSVRTRIPLTQWRRTGHRDGLREQQARKLEGWAKQPGAAVRDGHLELTADDAKVSATFEAQPWRSFLSWNARVSGKQEARFRVAGDQGAAATVGFATDGKVFYTTDQGRISAGSYRPGTWHMLKVEIDLASGKYNLYVDGSLVADFVPLEQKTSIDRFIVEGGKGLSVDEVWGVGYRPGDPKQPRVPYSIKTFIDQSFSVAPTVEGWAHPGYDDQAWRPTQLPYAHGGERYAGEDLYLRTKVNVGKFECAVLNFESLFPGGEIWIGGQPVEVRRNHRPGKLDVSRYLKPEAENVIAVRVDPNRVEQTMVHTAHDLHTGWFAGRMWLDLRAKRYIDDVFVHTQSVDDPAVLNLEVTVGNDDWRFAEREVGKKRFLQGEVVVSVSEWFPNESNSPSATAKLPVKMRLFEPYVVKGQVKVPAPKLWTPENPQLYRIDVRLESGGKVIDDYVVTTGIRTISQDGGTFQLSGRPAMLNGALLFGVRPPLDKVAQWLYCPPDEWIVKDLLMIKRMNGNTARMTFHDGPTGVMNDPRYAEIGDQLGILYQWQTGTWIRVGSPWQLDFEGLSQYVRQVRNHPSIAVWQPGNHPHWTGFEEGMRWFEKVHRAIYPNDPSRLISPAASMANRLFPPNDAGTAKGNGQPFKAPAIWTAPMITRGNMDTPTGYGAKWTTLRNWHKSGFRASFLNSNERAYFNFENEESAAQPNWSLRKGKPSYQIKSYERGYDNGSIGRMLTVDEWPQSQAWQAFSAYEAIRKQRWMDYDGFAWCCLRGGPNTATYQKPLVDYFGHAKLAYHAVGMAYQPLLAGSGDVDLVYGPDDRIHPLVLNLGDARTVDVGITVRKIDGEEVDRRVYKAVSLPAGRTVTRLEAWKPQVADEQHYVIEYIVTAG